MDNENSKSGEKEVGTLIPRNSPSLCRGSSWLPSAAGAIGWGAQPSRTSCCCSGIMSSDILGTLYSSTWSTRMVRPASYALGQRSQVRKVWVTTEGSRRRHLSLYHIKDNCIDLLLHQCLLCLPESHIHYIKIKRTSTTCTVKCHISVFSAAFLSNIHHI